MHMSFNLAGSLIGYYSLGHPLAFVILLFIGIYLMGMGLYSVRWYRLETAMPCADEDEIG